VAVSKVPPCFATDLQATTFHVLTLLRLIWEKVQKSKEHNALNEDLSIRSDPTSQPPKDKSDDPRKTLPHLTSIY